MIKVELYKWEGSFFPFKIKNHCGECSLNKKVIESVIEELPFDVEFKEKPWLNNWYKILHKGAYHAPIILVNGKLVKQEEVITREELKTALLKEYVKFFEMPEGVHIFTLPDCKFCKAAKELFKEKNINYKEYNVIENSLYMQELLHLVKGKIHPITLPQIFIDKKRIGGYEELRKFLK